MEQFEKKPEETFKNPREKMLAEFEIGKVSNLGGGVNETKFVEIIDDGSGVFKPKNGEKAGTEIVGEGYKRERACYLAAM
ncbi:MAG: hypothetical protein U9P90_03600, partial [Patescibacteria group bacterium]|nr:hypothetical protein [Patescibacteria group bacterium]